MMILGGLKSEKMAKKCHFLPPCGAQSRGSGGAPPTNLILLRNQRTRLVLLACAGTVRARAGRAGRGRGPGACCC